MPVPRKLAALQVLLCLTGYNYFQVATGFAVFAIYLLEIVCALAGKILLEHNNFEASAMVPAHKVSPQLCQFVSIGHVL